MNKTKILENHTKEVLDAVSASQLATAVMAGAFVLETAVKVSMSAASHSGHVYGDHQASAPGETPAVDTAVYVNSIASQLDRATDTDAYANVGTGQERGVWLEFGTSNMEARPHFRPAYDENETKIQDVIRNFIKRSISGAV